jgi:ribosomal protein S18 acetylase RimI-like enzyme
MHPLDPIIWNALTGPQAHFAEVAGSARRFPPAVTALGALAQPDEEGFASLARLQQPGDTTALFLEAQPALPAGWKMVHTISLAQMVHEGTAESAPKNGFVTLGPPDAAEMLALAQLTKPGPFGMRTGELGDFIGIRDASGNLVAMTGVRLHVPGFTEISAVCTHPDHLGKGYAGSLMLEIMSRIRRRRETPILHVRSNNTRAIHLYERLGFKQRRTFHLCVVAKPS